MLLRACVNSERKPCQNWPTNKAIPCNPIKAEISFSSWMMEGNAIWWSNKFGKKKKKEEQETLVIRVTPQLLVVLVFSSHAWTTEHLSGSGQPQMTKNPSLTPFELDRLITIFLGLKSVILLRHASQCVSWVSRGQSNISHRLLMHALRTSKSLTGALSMHQILYTKHHNQWQALSSSLIVQPLITHYKLHAPRGICHINIHEVSWHGQYL